MSTFDPSEVDRFAERLIRLVRDTASQRFVDDLQGLELARGTSGDADA